MTRLKLLFMCIYLRKIESTSLMDYLCNRVERRPFRYPIRFLVDSLYSHNTYLIQLSQIALGPRSQECGCGPCSVPSNVNARTIYSFRRLQTMKSYLTLPSPSDFARVSLISHRQVTEFVVFENYTRYFSYQDESVYSVPLPDGTCL